MSAYSFVLPPDFDDYESEVIAKGYFSEARIIAAGEQYQLNFYDTVRLNQEIESSFESDGIFFEPNLIIIRSITRIEMEKAVGQLLSSDTIFLSSE